MSPKRINALEECQEQAFFPERNSVDWFMSPQAA